MKEVHINYSGMDLDYKMASGLAASFAEKVPYITEPVMVAWHDKKASRMSPVIAGANINTRWLDYGEGSFRKSCWRLIRRTTLWGFQAYR